AFSGGGLTVSRMWHSLSDASTHAASVLASWGLINGLIPKAKIIQGFKDKKNREKNANKVPKTPEVIAVDW
ncbi:hypothetical protein K439DRAFT_1363575, partial [Ramaria rubella]